MAMIAIAAVFAASIIFGAPLYVILIQIAVLSAVSIFILTRPRPPHEKR